MERKRFAAWVAALSFLALPSFLPAAEMGHEGTHGTPHDHGGMKMDDHGKMNHGGHDMKSGELLFSGKIGPWTGEARLIDKKEHMEQSGVPAKFAARFAGERHLMMFLTDPTTGKPLPGAAGKVTIAGPDKASSSKVTLVVMGGHIGADVHLPHPGEYMFTAEVEAGGRSGSATFSHTLK